MESPLPALPPDGFATADQAQAALKEYAYNNGFDVAIHERYPRGGEVRRITFRCAKGRAVASQANDHVHDSKRRKSASQMIACPYRVNLKLVSGLWRLEGVASRGGGESSHNHEFLPAAAFSSFRQQNLREHQTRIITMWKSGVRPRQIITTLQEMGVEAVFSYQDLQNLLYAMRREELAGRTPIQWLFDVSFGISIASNQGCLFLHTNPYPFLATRCSRGVFLP